MSGDGGPTARGARTSSGTGNDRYDDGVRCLLMRGGTSKGAYFLADDLPADPAERDDLLLRIMGSPGPRQRPGRPDATAGLAAVADRDGGAVPEAGAVPDAPGGVPQVDGIGGGHPLTSKVAVVTRSADDRADVDYLFLQVAPDRPVVTDRQTCGNLLAGVGPFAIERGLVPVTGDVTRVRIRLLNPRVAYATADVPTPGGAVRYEGAERMSGTPFPAAPIPLAFPGAGRPVFPTGRLADTFAGLTVTCVDAGMPVVLLRAADLGLEGTERPEALEADAGLRARLEAVRREAGPAMGLRDVTDATVPKLCLVSPPRAGGLVTTRTFIPHRVHEAIGVLAAVSVAAGALVEGTVAHAVAQAAGAHTAGAHTAGARPPYRIEHPTGSVQVGLELAGPGPATVVCLSTVVRTARKLFDGLTWPRPAQERTDA